MLYGVREIDWHTTEFRTKYPIEGGYPTNAYWGKFRLFSTEEARTEYIEYNKECLSQKEVNEILSSVEIKRGIKFDNEYKECVKCALDVYVMNKLKSK